MTNHAGPKTTSHSGGVEKLPVQSSLTKRDSIHSNFNQSENKTGTKKGNNLKPCMGSAATTHSDLNIERVWREVVDFGEPTSGTGEEGWGRKRISVARVSMLDGPGRCNDPPPDE